jgi:hypothetical protein
LGNGGRRQEALQHAQEVSAASALHLPDTHEIALNSRFEVALWSAITDARENAPAQFQTFAMT